MKSSRLRAIHVAIGCFSFMLISCGLDDGQQLNKRHTRSSISDGQFYFNDSDSINNNGPGDSPTNSGFDTSRKSTTQRVGDVDPMLATRIGTGQSLGDRDLHWRQSKQGENGTLNRIEVRFPPDAEGLGERVANWDWTTRPEPTGEGVEVDLGYMTSDGRMRGTTRTAYLATFADPSIAAAIEEGRQVSLATKYALDNERSVRGAAAAMRGLNNPVLNEAHAVLFSNGGSNLMAISDELGVQLYIDPNASDFETLDIKYVINPTNPEDMIAAPDYDLYRALKNATDSDHRFNEDAHAILESIRDYQNEATLVTDEPQARLTPRPGVDSSLEMNLGNHGSGTGYYPHTPTFDASDLYAPSNLAKGFKNAFADGPVNPGELIGGYLGGEPGETIGEFVWESRRELATTGAAYYTMYGPAALNAASTATVVGAEITATAAASFTGGRLLDMASGGRISHYNGVILSAISDLYHLDFSFSQTQQAYQMELCDTFWGGTCNEPMEDAPSDWDVIYPDPINTPSGF